LATNPEDREVNPSSIQKVVKAIQAPVASRKGRLGVMLAFAGALISLSPFPFGAIGAAVIVYIAIERS